jgi:hypothetical protein
MRLPAFWAKDLIYKVFERIWWTWSGSGLTIPWITRNLLKTRFTKTPKMPTIPDLLYVYCTVNIGLSLDDHRKPSMPFCSGCNRIIEILP